MKQRSIRIKVRPKFVKAITFGFAAAITLWPFGIYLRKQEYLKRKVLINHESIHWAQAIETPGFYLIYVIEWAVKLFKYKGKAYYHISFEREAKAHEKDLNYLKNRKAFAWVKYM